MNIDDQVNLAILLVLLFGVTPNGWWKKLPGSYAALTFESFGTLVPKYDSRGSVEIPVSIYPV